LRPLEAELVSLDRSLRRVLAEAVRAPVDVPSFDRSNVDGYAVRAVDTFGASEQRPVKLELLRGAIGTGDAPCEEVSARQAIAIATGGMLPRGADAVVMVEHTDDTRGELLVRRAITPGANVTFTGTDIAAGELVLHAGETLTSRETGLIAAVGLAEVAVIRRARVGIVSTGDEIIAPGDLMRPALVYDSNSRILADSVRELGGEPLELGIVADDERALKDKLAEAIRDCDVVLLSGGTSKGAGDLCYRVVERLRDPGIVAHGVALKPGKPICLAATRGKAVVVLPGFPTSAIFTFHEFVAPVIRRLSGRAAERRNSVPASLALKVNSEIGRTEYLLVSLIEQEPHAEAGAESVPKYAAWPMGKGSGSVTTFSRADGFFVIGRHEEIVEASATVDVTLLGKEVQAADLVIIGSHCLGLDLLLDRMQARGWRTKALAVGSTAGLEAAKRGQCDVAGMHLLDPATDTYNDPFMTAELELVRGYGRMQGVVYRPGDERFDGHSAEQAIAAVMIDPTCVMVNRNAGSGTRILSDRLLEGATPPGYAVQPRNHNAVAAAVAQRRADWGVCIESAARQARLGFLPLAMERYDFVIPKARIERPAVQDFIRLLADGQVRDELAKLGLTP
jgi:putative molybdopterin biosynthesis protein